MKKKKKKMMIIIIIIQYPVHVMNANKWMYVLLDIILTSTPSGGESLASRSDRHTY
jgi:hypothetical protein